MFRINLRHFLAVHLLRPDDHLAHQLGHDGLRFVGGLLHLFMAHLDGDVEAAKVGDDAHAEDADAAMVSHDDFGHGAHAYGVAAQCSVHLILCGGLEGGALHAHVHAILQADAPLACYLSCQTDEVQVVGLVHVGESRAGGEVLAAQRVLGEEVDVVGDDHQVANLETGVHASCGVGYEECLDAQLVHHAHGEGHLLHRVALVVVEAALHGHDVYAAQLAEDELATVPLYGGDGEVGNLGVGELQFVSYFGS